MGARRRGRWWRGRSRTGGCGASACTVLQRETRTIPIVFTTGGDPVASSVVERLDRPNGNVTGFAFYEASLAGKWLELLSEIAPGLKRVAIMKSRHRPLIGLYALT